MKFTIITLKAVSLLAILVTSGCSNPDRARVSVSAPSGQRVIKVSFRGQRESFRLRINRNAVEKLRNVDFTNVMTRLHLDYGDIIVWEDQRDERGRELSQPDGISKWWSNYLPQVRASFYSINSDTITDFFATPIYHWKAPSEKPRPLHDTIFFADGATLGQGSSGFHMMLDTIEGQKSSRVFIVAPRIKNEGYASPWIADDQLLAWAQDAGMLAQFEKIFFERYGGLTDFAKLMDD